MELYRAPDNAGRAVFAAQVRLIVWCKECQHQGKPDPAEIAARCGEETSILDWREQPVCSRCKSRAVDMVVTGTDWWATADIRGA